jgi:hypothetical protein
MVTRDKRLHMLLSQDEWVMLQSLAERLGVTASDWVRLRIREAFEGQKAAKRPKPKR